MRNANETDILAEIDVGDPPVVLDDQHVLIVGDGAGVLKFAEPVTTIGLSESGSTSMNLVMHPVDVGVVGDVVELDKPTDRNR